MSVISAQKCQKCQKPVPGRLIPQNLTKRGETSFPRTLRKTVPTTVRPSVKSDTSATWAQFVYIVTDMTDGGEDWVWAGLPTNGVPGGIYSPEWCPRGVPREVYWSLLSPKEGPVMRD